MPARNSVVVLPTGSAMEGISRVMARIDSIRSQVPQPAGTFHDSLTAQLADAGTTSPFQAVARVPVGTGAGWTPAAGGVSGIDALPGNPHGVVSTTQLDEYLRTHRIEERNGRLDPSEVVTVSGGWDGRSMALLAPAATAWESMRAEAALSGIDLRLIDAYRSWEVQAGAYEDYLAGRKKANVLPPGTSEHGNGLAVDVTNGAVIDRSDPEWAWLEANARRFGWHPISNEAWHWEFRGL